MLLWADKKFVNRISVSKALFAQRRFELEFLPEILKNIIIFYSKHLKSYRKITTFFYIFLPVQGDMVGTAKA